MEWEFYGLRYIFPSLDCVIQHPYLVVKSEQPLKPWYKLKIMLHPNNQFYRLIFMSPGFTIYETRASFDLDGDMKECLKFYK